MVHQWVYRPTESEHELLMRFISESPEFTSAAQVVRESVLRLVHSDDRRRLYTDISDMIDQLHDTKEKFLNLVLKYSEEI